MAAQNKTLTHEIIHKELDLIQDVIKRMATNSFQVKAWMIGILSALVVIESKSLFIQASDSNAFSIKMNVFLFLPIICFWYLDAFFLSTEKLYRELYKWVVNNRSHTNVYLYDLNTFKRFEFDEEGNPKKNDSDKLIEQTNLIKPKNGVFNVMFSNTLLPFYIVPILFVAGLFYYNVMRH